MLSIVATADRGVSGRVPHGARGMNGDVDPGKQTPHFTLLNRGSVKNRPMTEIQEKSKYFKDKQENTEEDAKRPL